MWRAWWTGRRLYTAGVKQDTDPLHVESKSGLPQFGQAHLSGLPSTGEGLLPLV
jgi:hypothetical protein